MRRGRTPTGWVGGVFRLTASESLKRFGVGDLLGSAGHDPGLRWIALSICTYCAHRGWQVSARKRPLDVCSRTHHGSAPPVPVLVAWDSNPTTARTLAAPLTKAGLAFRYAPKPSGVLSAVNGVPNLVLLRGELSSPEVNQIVTAFSKLDTHRHVPMILLCEDVSERSLVQQLRTGVVDLFSAPFDAATYPQRLVGLLEALPQRSGTVSGLGVARMLEHIKLLARSGVLELRAGGRQVGRAPLRGRPPRLR